ncbi:MAG: hypothetical protein M1544_01660 [Candidatus Marsarchaeota archaeon]|nr:hypothetical protein [Candidatus Marsarchaeota archaeon]MCL5102042.1 hypothetical protein [Candidatus Marsarchaeota archaeon]
MPAAKKEVTPKIAVKRLINCFETANKEINEALGKKVPERELKARVKLFVGDAFRKCDVDIHDPSKEGLKKAMNECRINTEKMLGKKAAPIIKKHYAEMEEIIEKLPDDGELND